MWRPSTKFHENCFQRFCAILLTVRQTNHTENITTLVDLDNVWLHDECIKQREEIRRWSFVNMGETSNLIAHNLSVRDLPKSPRGGAWSSSSNNLNSQAAILYPGRRSLSRYDSTSWTFPFCSKLHLQLVHSERGLLVHFSSLFQTFLVGWNLFSCSVLKCCSLCHLYTASFSSGGGQRSFRSRVQGQMERQRCCHQDHRERIRKECFCCRGTICSGWRCFLCSPLILTESWVELSFMSSFRSLFRTHGLKGKLTHQTH